MTEEFIRKRIDEQINYIAEIMLSDTTSQRKNEILVSACGQLRYFRSKLHKEVMRRKQFGTLAIVGHVAVGTHDTILQMLHNKIDDIGAVLFIDKASDFDKVKEQLYPEPPREPIVFTAGSIVCNPYNELPELKEIKLKDNFTNNPIGAIGSKNKRKRDYGRGNGR